MKSHHVSPVFAFGGQYAPVAKATAAPMEDWEKDLRQAADLGFSAFRIFVPWDRIETREGVRDFSQVDRALELAGSLGLKVMVNIGGVFSNLQGIYPPRWLIGRCQNPVPPHLREDACERTSSPRQLVCMDDPLYQAKALEFVEAAAARIAPHPAVHSWVVWNEPASPPCYCHHTVAAFRAWLREKYGGLAALNRAWSTEFPVDYGDWSEVGAPHGVGFLDGGYGPYLDYRNFLRNRFEALLGRIVAAVKKHDRLGRPTTVNMVTQDVFGEFVRPGVNPWKVGKILDVAGFSAYLNWSGDGCPPADRAAIFSRIRGCSRAPGGDWFVIETEAGPMYWVHGVKPQHTYTGDRLVRHWQSLAHGAKSILCWMYRSRVTDAQAGEFGMLAWDGAPTERAVATGEMSKVVNQNADLFLSRHAARGKVGIVCSDSTGLLYGTETFEAAGKPEFGNFWAESWKGAFKMLYDLRIPAEIVDGDAADAAGLGAYKALLLPFHVNLDAKLAAALAGYVKNGGLVIADFPFGFKDSSGRLLGRAPGQGLADVFGAWTNDALPLRPDMTAPIRTAGGLEIAPCEFRQDLHPEKDAEVVGTWADGRAAITAHRHGAGRAVLAGTMLFRGYYRNPQTGVPTRTLLRDLLHAAGVRPVAAVSGAPEAQLAGVEVCRLDTLDGKGAPVFIVLNYNRNNAVSLTVAPRDWDPPAGGLADLVSGGPVAAAAAGFALSLEPETVAVVAAAADAAQAKRRTDP